MRTLKELIDSLNIGVLQFAFKIKTMFDFWAGEVQRLAVGLSKKSASKKRGISNSHN